ncbi:hypothetical protein N7638_02625 [Achromobacter mucicolens]|uniref:hypothetical protein n=1 Tax=Achromobacter mucicolens TaxID=1389922 RepID=UPI00244D6185|nr:hypothetical protein [Achromobacter mucicolens]MDG9966917.1 hypothetical protein [Achromobacter mucicolens]
MEVDQARRRAYLMPALRFALRRALQRRSPDQIPMGPAERLAERDYATTYIDGSSIEKYWLADMLDGDQLRLRQIEEGGDVVSSGEAKLRDLRHCNFRVIVYFKHMEWRFFSLYRYAFFSIFGMARLRVAFDNFLQIFTNRASLPTIERTKALQVAVDRVSSGERSLTLSDILPIQGRQHRHPGLRNAFHFHAFVLDSLVETGEFKCNNLGLYEITPKALATLDQYRMEERRVKAQGRAAFWTALLAAIVGGVVSGIISLK